MCIQTNGLNGLAIILKKVNVCVSIKKIFYVLVEIKLVTVSEAFQRQVWESPPPFW
jgi:hypothetical protein